MAKEKNLINQLKSIQKSISDSRYCMATSYATMNDYRETLDILILVNNELQLTIEDAIKTNEKQAVKIAKLLKELEKSKNAKE